MRNTPSASFSDVGGGRGTAGTTGASGGPPPRPAGGGVGVISAWRVAGFACAPRIYASNTGQPPRFCTIRDGNFSPLLSR